MKISNKVRIVVHCSDRNNAEMREREAVLGVSWLVIVSQPICMLQMNSSFLNTQLPTSMLQPKFTKSCTVCTFHSKIEPNSSPTLA